VIGLLAKALRRPKSAFGVVSGETARDKTLRIEAENLEDALSELGKAV
jgi:uncharacterized protein YggU (UPF0235/DUF167 family)